MAWKSEPRKEIPGVKKIFDMDNPFMQALSVAADLIALNILALLC